MAFVYVHNKKDKAQDDGPYIIQRLYDDEHRDVPDAPEPEYEFNADAYARASALNRGIGYSEKQAGEFQYRVHLEKKQRLREEAHRRQEERRLADEAERKRKREEEIAAGSPGGRSPAAVDKDDAYEKVWSGDGSTWPASIKYVVRHKPTGALWACIYGIRDDDSDYECAATWQRVEAKTKTITVYEPVKESPKTAERF